MKLNVKAYGVAFAIIWMISVVWAIVIAMIGKSTAAFDVANALYLGWLSPTLGGLVLGMVIAFFDGLVAGVIFALIYNALAKRP